jgi:hypothetical protein
VQTAEPYVEPPNDVDIEMAIRKLQNRKAAGYDQITAAFVKGGGKYSRRSFTKSSPKYWRKRSYHMSEENIS